MTPTALELKKTNKSTLHLETSTPGVTLELQIRRQRDVFVKRINDDYNETSTAKGEAVLYARFVGDISHLTNPAIAILHKRSRYHKKTITLPDAEEFDKKIESLRFKNHNKLSTISLILWIIFLLYNWLINSILT